MAPDRRALHAHLQRLDLGEIVHRLVDEDVARAAARIADQHHLGLFVDLVGDRLEQIGVEHLVPVREVAEKERRVDEWRGLREGRHVRRRHDRVVDRFALRHVLEILLLQAERGIAVQHEVDRLAVVFLDQFFELQERLVEGVIVVELHRAVERDDLGLRRRSGVRGYQTECRDGGDKAYSKSHQILPQWAAKYSKCPRCCLVTC